MPWNTAAYQTMLEAEFAAGQIGKSEQGKRIGSNLEYLNAQVVALGAAARADAFAMVPVELPPFGMDGTPTFFFKIPILDTALGSIGGAVSQNSVTAIEGGLLIPTANPSFAYALFKTKALKLFVGSYPGDGNDSKAITGVGFQPDALIIGKRGSPTDATLQWVATKDSIATGGGFLTRNFSGTVATGRIESLDIDGFNLNGVAVEPNIAGQTYWFVAIKDAVADPTLKTKIDTYTGNGGATQSITGLGFTPQFVLVANNTTGVTSATVRTACRSHAIAGANCRGLTGFGGATTPFAADIDIISDGFTVRGTGTGQLNQNTIEHLYIAIKGGGIIP